MESLTTTTTTSVVAVMMMMMTESESESGSGSGSGSVTAFVLMFLCIYLVAYLMVFRNWGPTLREEASSCFMSLFHGTPAVLLSLHALPLTLTLTDHPFTCLASPNTPAQNTVLDFSTAYFLIDLLHYLLFFPTNFLFILHHLATLYVFLTCRFSVCRGAVGLLLLLILAEVTSPCQNVWSLSRLRRSDVPLATRVYHLLTPPFLAFYSLVRGFLGPLLVLKMFLFFVTQDHGPNSGPLPAWAWISWMAVIVVAIFVSVLWVRKHWSLWYAETSLVKSKVN